jgi:hypothetical protein
VKLDALAFVPVPYVHSTLTAESAFPSMVDDWLSFDRSRLDEPSNRGAMERLFATYIKEMWLTELHPPATLDTDGVVDALLRDDREEAQRLLAAVCEAPRSDEELRGWEPPRRDALL